MATCCVKKDRLEKRFYAVDFVNALESGDSLSGTPTVKVTQRSRGGTHTDVSTQFGSPTGNISGTEVQFTLAAATGSDQAAGRYFGRVTTDTTNQEILVETFEIEVTDEGDVSAP